MWMLILGLVLFLGIHSISIVALSVRDKFAAKSELGWKLFYSIVSLAGIILIVKGYAELRQTPTFLYVTPVWLRHVAATLMLPIFILFLAPYFPGRIHNIIKHPQLTAVILWAVAHLLVNGTLADLQGFVILIAFELPLMHLLLHVIWSPLAANIMTLLTVFALVFFYAEYRAVSRRPISLFGDTLMVRFGLYQPFIIPLANIAGISQSHDFIKRAKDLIRYNYSGVPNIEIELIKPIGDIKKVYLGVDQPESLIRAVYDKKQGLSINCIGQPA